MPYAWQLLTHVGVPAAAGEGSSWHRLRAARLHQRSNCLRRSTAFGSIGWLATMLLASSYKALRTLVAGWQLASEMFARVLHKVLFFLLSCRHAIA